MKSPLESKGSSWNVADRAYLVWANDRCPVYNGRKKGLPGVRIGGDGRPKTAIENLIGAVMENCTNPVDIIDSPT